MAPEFVHHLGGNFVFAFAGRAGLHGAHMGTRGNARRLAHGLDLAAALEQAHVVQHVVERNHLLRRVAAVARLGAQAIDPADHSLIELRVRAHGVEHLGAVLHESREDFVDIRDREGVIGPVVARGALRPGAPAIPGLTRRIAIADEEYVFTLRAAWHQHGHRLGLGETGQIEEVAVRSIGIFDVVIAQAHRGGGHDGDGVAAHELHQGPPAPLEFLATDRLDRRRYRPRRDGRFRAFAARLNVVTRHRAPAPVHGPARTRRTAIGPRRARIRPPRRKPLRFLRFVRRLRHPHG